MFHLPMRNSLQSLSQRGVAQLLLLILLIAGIGVGTLVIQQRTNLLPHAEQEGYEGDRESEPDHGETNVESEKAETEQRDDGGNSPGDDGSTFENQSKETKDAFRAAYPDDPEGAWNAEHAEELRTGYTRDGREIRDGKPVEKDQDGDGDIDVADAALQVQIARENQAAIRERDAAKEEFDRIVANDNYDIVAAKAAFERLQQAEAKIAESGQSYAEAVAITHARENDFNKAVESAMSSKDISDEDLGSVIGHIASLFGKTPEQAAQEAAQAIADQYQYTSSSIGSAAGMAAYAAGGSAQKAMSAAADAIAQRSDNPTQALNSAVATGQALGLSNEEIAAQVRSIADQKGYEPELAESLIGIPGLENRSAAETEALAEKLVKGTKGDMATPAAGPPPTAAPQQSETVVINLTIDELRSSVSERDQWGKVQSSAEFQYTSNGEFAAQVSADSYGPPGDPEVATIIINRVGVGERTATLTKAEAEANGINLSDMMDQEGKITKELMAKFIAENDVMNAKK